MQVDGPRHPWLDCSIEHVNGEVLEEPVLLMCKFGSRNFKTEEREELNYL